MLNDSDIKKGRHFIKVNNFSKDKANVIYKSKEFYQ